MGGERNVDESTFVATFLCTHTCVRRLTYLAVPVDLVGRVLLEAHNRLQKLSR